MSFKKLEGHENYCVTVINLPPKEKVEGLDNLVKVTVFGNDCLVGKDSDEHALYLFFPAESQIDPEFLCANNLYRDSALNQDKTKKGFFEPNGRVKALKFKGIISTGFVIPVASLDQVGDKYWSDDLKVGDEFNAYDDEVLCKKYRIVRMQPTVTREERERRKQERFDKLVANQFRFHESTAHLAKNLDHFHPEDIIVITDKWHGTSAVYANVLIKKPLTLVERIAKFFGAEVVDKQYDVLYASRTVIKNQYINKYATAGFYNEDIWAVVKKELEGKIEPGITLYGEMVGFLPSGRAIQGGYDYGCVGNHKFVVYRITYTKPDGNVIEYTWHQIRDYCRKYQLETVKLEYHGKLKDFLGAYNDDRLGETLLLRLSHQYLEGDCKWCTNKVPREGICIRIDGRENYSTYKLKSKRFLERETKELDSGQVNIEDEQLNEAVSG